MRCGTDMFCELATNRGSDLFLDELSSPFPNTKSRSSTRLSTSLRDIGDDASVSDLPSPSMIPEFTSAQKSSGKGGRKGKEVVTPQDSLSSISAGNDFEESDYSTPGTSAVATPAELTKPIIHRAGTSLQRGRRATAAVVPTPSVNASVRARALANSEFSLGASRNKRKRVDSEDEDEDNTPDAQLARALQEQEDSVAKSMVATSELPVRRTPRKTQQILPKLDFDPNFSDDDDEDEEVWQPEPPAPISKKLKLEPRVELPRIPNSTSFGSSKKAKVVQDSDQDDFIEIDSDSDVPLSRSTRSSRIKPSPAVAKNSRMAKVIEQQSQAFLNQVKAASSTGKRKSLRSNAMDLDTASPTVAPRLYGDRFIRRANPPTLKAKDRKDSDASSALTDLSDIEFPDSPSESELDSMLGSDTESDEDIVRSVNQNGVTSRRTRINHRHLINSLEERSSRRGRMERARLVQHHPEINTMWKDLENLPKIGDVKIDQPANINRELKPFQLQGVAWMRAMEKTEWGGGLLGDEMGMGKTIQAVSLIMSDYPAKQPSLVLIPPVALMQWQQEIADYTDGTLKTFVFHGSNAKTKGIGVKDLMKYNVILMSYNSLESMYRKQEKGFKRKNGLHKEKSPIHQIHFHRVILDEAHSIKVRPTLPSIDKTNSRIATNVRFCKSMLRTQG
jgi:DNA repair protein RAD16